MKHLRRSMILAAITLALSGCGANNEAAPAEDGGQAAAPAEDGGQAAAPETDAAVETTATAVYESNCMACHGTDLQGGGSFPNLQQVGARLSREEILDRIQNGGNGMPAFQGVLNDDQIQALTEWLAEKK